MFKNNVSVSNQFGTANGNVANVDINTLFVDYNGNLGYSNDSRWQLTPYSVILGAPSPAIGAADDGGDCGIFGGAEPYVLSGLPAVPAIFEFDSHLTGTSSGGLNVNVKVKSHK